MGTNKYIITDMSLRMAVNAVGTNWWKSNIYSTKCDIIQPTVANKRNSLIEILLMSLGVIIS